MLDFWDFLIHSPLFHFSCGGFWGGVARWIGAKKPFWDGLSCAVFGVIAAPWITILSSPRLLPIFGEFGPDAYLARIALSFFVGYVGTQWLGFMFDLIGFRREKNGSV